MIAVAVALWVLGGRLVFDALRCPPPYYDTQPRQRAELWAMTALWPIIVGWWIVTDQLKPNDFRGMQ